MTTDRKILADKAKNFVENHKLALAKVAVAVTTLGVVYYIGKSRGAIGLEVILNAQDADPTSLGKAQVR